jgi:translation initiation factor IF-1
MSKEDLIEFRGVVTDVLPNCMYKVKLENESVILCYSSGKIRQNKIKIIQGDSVTVEFSGYDLSRGRVKYRH